MGFVPRAPRSAGADGAVVLNWLQGLIAIQQRAAAGLAAGAEWADAFAARAYEFWELGHAGWDETLCGGGMIWSPVRRPRAAAARAR